MTLAIGSSYTMMFYPLVHPPKTILFEAALYWDSLTSLVPTSPEYFAAHGNSKDLQILRSEGVYVPTLLDSQLHDMDQLIEELEEISEEFDLYHHPPSEELTRYTRLWQGKLPKVIEHGLFSRGLIVKDEANPGAYRGHSGMLTALLSLTASHAARQLEAVPGAGRYVPNTSSDFANLCSTAPAPANSRHTAPSWLIDASRALPVPPQDTPLDKVLAFRDEFSEERKACVRAIRDLQGRLRQTVGDPTELAAETRYEVDAALRDLRFGMRARFGDISRRTVLMTVAAVAPLGAEMLRAPFATAGAVAVSGLAVNIASRSIKPRDHRFSYIHQLERRFPAARVG